MSDGSQVMVPHFLHGVSTWYFSVYSTFLYSETSTNVKKRNIKAIYTQRFETKIIGRLNTSYVFPVSSVVIWSYRKNVAQRIRDVTTVEGVREDV